MGVQQDVAAARAALRELKRATAGLRQHHRDGLHAQRLHLDVERLEQDLDLLVGPDRTRGTTPTPLEIIDDREYPPDFWKDAQDEGIGPR